MGRKGQVFFSFYGFHFTSIDVVDLSGKQGTWLDFFPIYPHMYVWKQLLCGGKYSNPRQPYFLSLLIWVALAKAPLVYCTHNTISALCTGLNFYFEVPGEGKQASLLKKKKKTDRTEIVALAFFTLSEHGPWMSSLAFTPHYCVSHWPETSTWISPNCKLVRGQW